MLDDRPERERGEEREAADDEDHADEQTHEQAPGRRKGSGGFRHRLFDDQRAGHRHHRDDHKVSPDQHGEAAGRVVPKGIAGEACEGGTVVGGLRREQVEHFAEAVRAGILDAGQAEGQHHGYRGEGEHRQRQDQNGEHRHFDLLRLDLLAQVFRRATHHQAGHEHGDDDHEKHAVEARADAAEDDLAEFHVDDRDHPAERRETVVHGIHGAVRGVGGGHRPQAGIGDAEADLLAFHVGGIDAERGEVRIARALRPVGDQHACQEHDRHGGVERPALPLVLDHPSEGVGQRGRDQQDVEHLEEVAERRRILVGHRRVGVPEAAAVGAELLDRDLRGCRPLAQRLGRAFQRGGVDIGPDVLRNALPDEEEGRDKRKRQQHVQRAPRQVDPEIADRLARGTRKGPNERDGERDARSGGDEVLRRQRRHLGEIAHRALAAVVLPVGVRREADGGIEGEIRSDGGHARRIERQHRLEALQRVDQKEPRGIEDEHRDRIGEPVLLARFVDAGGPIEDAFDGAEDGRQERPLAFEHPRHEASERNHERGQHHEIQGNLHPAVGRHGRVLLRTARASAERRSGRPAAPQ